MNEQIENARRQLGELGAMAAKTEAAERDILARAEKRLEEVESGLDVLRRQSLGSDEAGQSYTDAVEERGRLHQVIAQARQTLATAAE